MSQKEHDVWWEDTPTPSYVIDEGRLIGNLVTLHELEQDANCSVLLAQKAFSIWSLYPLIGQYLSGTSASGLFEARLAHENFEGQNHVFSVAYRGEDMAEISTICDHVIFNSVNQYHQHHEMVRRCSNGMCSIGMRINPEYSTQEKAIYDPCAFGSRLGATYDEFMRGFADRVDGEGIAQLPDDVEGLHFHTMCEQDANSLIGTFRAFEDRFRPYLKQVKWLNMGGGQHITKPGYDLASLKKLINNIQANYGLKVYLEPGEAVALDAGYLVSEVLDIVHNDIDILILDTSAVCHMPDVLEMPYRPPVRNGYPAGEREFTYRLSSTTCLAGDIVGDYSFDHPVHVGDRLIFEDMAIYTMVKNNTFNGMPLPSIAVLQEDGSICMIKEFGYEDFKMRLS